MAEGSLTFGCFWRLPRFCGIPSDDAPRHPPSAVGSGGDPDVGPDDGVDGDPDDGPAVGDVGGLRGRAHRNGGEAGKLWARKRHPMGWCRLRIDGDLSGDPLMFDLEAPAAVVFPPSVTIGKCDCGRQADAMGLISSALRKLPGQKPLKKEAGSCRKAWAVMGRLASRPDVTLGVFLAHYLHFRLSPCRLSAWAHLECGRSACPAGVQSGKAQCLLARASSGTLRGRRLPEGRPAGQSMPPRPPPFAPAFRPCGVSERRLSVPTSFINQIAESSRSGRTPLIWMAAVLASSNGDTSTALPRDDERHYGRNGARRPLDLPKWGGHSCLE